MYSVTASAVSHCPLCKPIREKKPVVLVELEESLGLALQIVGIA